MLGFVFGEALDDVFMTATFPEGWTREATDHSMWSRISDAQGRVRVDVFYKAAFYDRNADATLRCRFTTGFYYDEQSQQSPAGGVILDDEKEVLRFPNHEDGFGGSKAADAALAELRPKYRDPLAYWDEGPLT